MKEGGPKRESGLSRMVAGDSEYQEGYLEFYKRIFENQKTQEYERVKTPEENRVIGAIIGKMDGFVKKYGGEPVPLKAEHIHFLEVEAQEGPEQGFYSPSHQFIGIIDQKDAEANAVLVAHEILHFNSFQSADIDRESKPFSRRQGFEIKTVDKEFLFHSLNEAVIAELTTRFQKENLNEILHPLQKKENIFETEQILVFQDVSRPVDHREEREDLRELIANIYERNKNEFHDAEDIFSLFAEAVMAGKLLPVARLIEKTYGKGAFRALGEITKDKK